MYKEGKFIIGTTDTLNETNYRHMQFNSDLNLGFRHELTFQGMRDYSPYINFNIVGETILKNHTIETTKYELIINCDFDSHAYYEVTSFGKNVINCRNSFTQSLNPPIYKQLNVIDPEATPTFTYCSVYHIGYIDNDSIMDLILEIKGKRYLFLTQKHNFEEQTIFHLAQVWNAVHFYEF